MPKLTDMRAFAAAHLKRPQTFAGAAFLALGAGMVANALFLQAGPHPAPYFFTRERPSLEAQPNELVRAVQDALMQIGFYTGTLDGIAGPQTRSAIEAFEAESGGEVSGTASIELLAKIRSTTRPDLSPVATRIAEPAEQQSPVQIVAPAAQPDSAVAAIQDALARSAYGPLIADGVAGPDTREAIMRFQRDHNLPVTGEISDVLVVELRSIGALGGG